MAIVSYSDSDLNSILEQFTVPKAQYTFQPMTSGLINDTFLVSKSGKPLYALQRINDHVFKNVEGLMINIDRALKHLKGKEYGKITLNRNISTLKKNKQPVLYNIQQAFLEKPYLPIKTAELLHFQTIQLNVKYYIK